MIYNYEPVISVGKGSPLTISWELVTHCQLSCSYCYFNPYESQTNYPAVMKMILNKLSKIEENFEVTLLGGEPTLHPQFYELIEALHSMKYLTKIDIITNFQTQIDFWEPIQPFKDKIEIVLSYHVEYQQKGFFKKVKKLQDKFSMNIIFLVHNDLKYLSSMKVAADEYFSLGLDFIPITFARLTDRTGSETKYFEYQDETIAFLEMQEERVKNLKHPETILITTKNQMIEMNQLEFANKKLNRFSGWKCQMNALIIHPDGMVSYPCTKIKKHILFAELTKRNLLCEHEICPCEAYWSFTKEK